MKFINHIWKPYSSLTNNEKQYQSSLKVFSGLCEYSDGIEFTFIPLKSMQELLDRIRIYYDFLQVEDTSVALENEVYFTSRIEGADTTLLRTHELVNGARVDESNYFSEMMIKGAFNATKYLNLKSNKISKDIILQMWNILVEGSCNNEDIRGKRFRTGNVAVGNHIGLDKDLIEDAIDTWIEFYESNELEDYPWIKAILLHYAFEYIHPFCDGNGRAGRLLMNNYLISRNFEKVKAVSFSHVIDENRKMYYSAFDNASNVYNDITFFINYFLSIINQAFYNCNDAMNIKYPKEFEEEAFEKGLSVFNVASNYEGVCPRTINKSFLDRAIIAYKMLHIE